MIWRHRRSIGSMGTWEHERREMLRPSIGIWRLQMLRASVFYSRSELCDARRTILRLLALANVNSPWINDSCHKSYQVRHWQGNEIKEIIVMLATTSSRNLDRRNHLWWRSRHPSQISYFKLVRELHQGYLLWYCRRDLKGLPFRGMANCDVQCSVELYLRCHCPKLWTCADSTYILQRVLNDHMNKNPRVFWHGHIVYWSTANGAQACARQTSAVVLGSKIRMGGGGEKERIQLVVQIERCPLFSHLMGNTSGLPRTTNKVGFRQRLWDRWRDNISPRHQVRIQVVEVCRMMFHSANMNVRILAKEYWE